MLSRNCDFLIATPLATVIATHSRRTAEPQGTAFHTATRQGFARVQLGGNGRRGSFVVRVETHSNCALGLRTQMCDRFWCISNARSA